MTANHDTFDVDVDTVDIHVPDAVEPGDSFSIKMDVSIDSGDSHYEIVELQAYLAGKKQEHFLGKRTFPYWNVPGGHAPVDLTYEVPVSGETVATYLDEEIIEEEPPYPVKGHLVFRELSGDRADTYWTEATKDGITFNQQY